MTAYWDAFADGPWGGTDLYIQLLEKYPNAKYILTERDPEAWYNSFEKLITKFDLNLDTALASYHTNRWGSGYYFESLFNIKTLAGNRQKIIEAYTRYNHNVIEYFRSKNKELLVLDLSKVNGWEVICPFLNCAVPNLVFPHLNKSPANPYASNFLPKENNSPIVEPSFSGSVKKSKLRFIMSKGKSKFKSILSSVFKS
jgi:hypothetical protein